MQKQAIETTSGETGVRICGLKVFKGDKYHVMDRSFGRTLSAANLPRVILDFVGPKRTEIKSHVLRIHGIVSKSSMRCYGASLLIAYDMDSDNLSVNMIDFAHSEFNNQGPDLGLLTGLEYLLSILTEF